MHVVIDNMISNSKIKIIHLLFLCLDSGDVDISYLNWIWSNERDNFLHCVMLARANMERLEKCIKGKQILGVESQVISEILVAGCVPGSWVIIGGKVLQNDQAGEGYGKQMSIDVFLDLTERRVKFCEVISILI